MNNITKYEGYEFVGMGLATIYLLPQIYISYQRKQMLDISAASLWCLLFAGCIWFIYMWEHKYYYFCATTCFVIINTFILLCMKFYFYQIRYLEHMKTFDKDQPALPPQISITTKQHDEIENAV